MRRKKYSQKKERAILLAPAVIIGCVFLILAVRVTLPNNRFKMVSKNPALKPTEIKVAGLTAFLASSWVVSFQLGSEDIALIVKERGLIEVKNLDFEKSISANSFLKRVDWLAKQDRPNRPITYKWKNPNPESSVWVYLFYEPDTERAWFYSGFQN